MRFHIFGFLLLVSSLSTVLGQSYYVNVVNKEQVRVFNLKQYAGDSAETKSANGVTPENQKVLDFVTTLYQDISAAVGTKYAASTQLEVTATAISQTLLSPDTPGAYSLSRPGLAALATLKDTLNQLDQLEPNSPSKAALLNLANQKVVEMNTNANDLPLSQNDPAQGILAALVPELVTTGAETVETIEVDNSHSLRG